MTDIETVDKLLYLAPMPEGRSLEDFRPRWRAHGRLGASLPLWRNVSRYAQNDTIDAATLDGISPGFAERARITPGFGGVGIVWPKSPGGAARLRADDGRVQLMLPDEIETFGVILDDQVLTCEHKIFDRGQTVIRFFEFIGRRGAMSREQFSSKYLEFGQAFGSHPASDLCSSYTQNHVAGELSSASAEGGCDAVAEFGFASLEDFAAFSAQPAAADLRDKADAFIDHDNAKFVLTREELLYDREQGINLLS